MGCRIQMPINGCEEDIDVSGEIFNFSGPTIGGVVGSNSGPGPEGEMLDILV